MLAAILKPWHAAMLGWSYKDSQGAPWKEAPDLPKALQERCGQFLPGVPLTVLMISGARVAREELAAWLGEVISSCIRGIYKITRSFPLSWLLGREKLLPMQILP